MRASIAVERAGYPSSSIVLTGFIQQGKAIARALGMPQLAIAEYPGVIMMDSNEEVRKKVESVLVDRIIEGLGRPIEKIEQEVEPGPHDIVFKGTLDGGKRFL